MLQTSRPPPILYSKALSRATARQQQTQERKGQARQQVGQERAEQAAPSTIGRRLVRNNKAVAAGPTQPSKKTFGFETARRSRSRGFLVPAGPRDPRQSGGHGDAPAIENAVLIWDRNAVFNLVP